MNINLLKELEDVKQTNAELISQSKPMQDDKIKRTIKEALDGFTKFFTEKGFQIDESEQCCITASYGNLMARIKYEISETGFFAAPICFKLSLKLPEMKDYIVTLNSKEFCVKDSPSNAKTKSEDVLREAKAETERIKTRIKEYPNEIWMYEIKLYNERRPSNSKQHDSMYELLVDVIS